MDMCVYIYIYRNDVMLISPFGPKPSTIAMSDLQVGEAWPVSDLRAFDAPTETWPMAGKLWEIYGS